MVLADIMVALEAPIVAPAALVLADTITIALRWAVAGITGLPLAVVGTVLLIEEAAAVACSPCLGLSPS